MDTKVCRGPCGLEKLVDEFWVARTNRYKDGRKNECKECAKARRRSWAAQNREREAEWNRAKYAANPDYFKARAGEYRARLAQAFVESIIPSEVHRRDVGICGICQEPVGKDYHIDHIIPLVKGGMHSYANVQIAHPECNLRKKDKLPWG